jgi:hypothetical protein
MGEKRKAMVRKYQYDVKNAAHLIRLLRMGAEFIESGNLQVYRTTDAEERKRMRRRSLISFSACLPPTAHVWLRYSSPV